jgi:putative Holliday junction resolvase
MEQEYGARLLSMHNQRILGIDYGDKRVGIAISDPLNITAQPLKVVESPKVIDEVLALINQYSVEKIIVGLPRNLKGQNTPQTEKVLRFIEVLKTKAPVAVEVYDERFSTAASERVLIEADVSRRKRKQVIDKMAAAYMLQGYMDNLRPTVF